MLRAGLSIPVNRVEIIVEKQEFLDHGLWQWIEDTVRAIEYFKPANDGNQKAWPSIKARTLVALAHLKSFKKEELSPFFSVSQLVEFSQEVQSRLDSAISGGSIFDIELSVDVLVKSLSSWSSIISLAEGVSSDVGVNTAPVVEAFSGHLDSFGERENELQEKLAKLGDRAQHLGEKLGEVEERAEGLDDRIARAASEQEANFAAAQEERRREFKEELDDAREALSAKQKELESEGKKIIESLADLRGRGEKRLNEVEKLANKVTSSLLARDHGTYANRDFWSGIAAYVAGIAAIVIGAVFLFSSLGEISPAHAPSWQWLLLKVSIGALVTGVAAVLFRLGGRLLGNSAETKRRELELRSIVPFLEGVDEESAKKAKIDFIDRAYGHYEPAGKKADVKDADLENATALLEKLISIVQGLNKGS